MDSFFLSNNSVGFINAAIMAVAATVYLFLQQNKSRPNWLLAFFFLFQSISFVGYIIWFSFYSPGSTYATYLAYSVWIGLIFLMQFAYSFQKNIHPRESKIALAVALLASFIAFAQYISQSQPMVYDYRFDLHNFLPRTSGADYSLAIIFSGCPLWTFIVLIRKTIKLSAYNCSQSKILKIKNSLSSFPVDGSVSAKFSSAYANIIKPCGKDAKAARNIALTILLLVLTGIFFWLSVTGCIGFSTFSYVSTTSSMILCFFMVISFLNYTKTSSILLLKLVGVSLVVALIIIGTISKFPIGYLNSSYDESRVAEVGLIKELVKTGDFMSVPNKVKYIVSLPFSENSDRNGINLIYASRNDFNLNTIIDGLQNIASESIIRNLVDPGTNRTISHRSYLVVSGNINYIHYNFLQNYKLYMVGYNYVDLRETIHNTFCVYVYITLASTLIIICGFSLYFNRILVKPLKRLHSVVKNAGNGDYDLKLDVNDDDEIGQISGAIKRIVNSIDSADNKQHDYSGQLKELVKDKGADLRRSHRELEILKSQQISDYYQTSLLLKSLSTNCVESETMSVDFLIRQRKQFIFKDKQEQLGGDLCIAKTIYLADRPFTLFLSADAAANSIQGASCAIILGSAFESIIERTKWVTSTNELYPETWLKNSFIELQNMFNRFNNSVHISIVAGLADDSSGLMYYINAGHPRNVIYRNKKAGYVDNKTVAGKLGETGNKNNHEIHILQLKPNDVFIAGSSGRDNVLPERSRGRVDVKNNDESLFLKFVEEGDGILSDIYKEIHKRGDVMDDVSLLRINYSKEQVVDVDKFRSDEVITLIKQSQSARQFGNLNTALIAAEKAFNIDSNGRPEVLKELVQVHALIKNYEKAASLAETYIDLCPGDTNFLYIAAFCLKKVGNLKKAADLGERVIIREPQMVKNLVNLSHVYMLQKNYSLADKYINDALKLDKNNRNALNIKSALSNRMRKS